MKFSAYASLIFMGYCKSGLQNVFGRVADIEIFRKMPSTRLMKFIVYASSIIVTVFMLLPRENIGGNPVPKIIFNGRPTPYQAFLVSNLFAFTGSFGALVIIGIKPNIARIYCFYSIASMAAAISILLYAIASSESFILPCGKVEGTPVPTLSQWSPRIPALILRPPLAPN